MDECEGSNVMDEYESGIGMHESGRVMEWMNVTVVMEWVDVKAVMEWMMPDTQTSPLAHTHASQSPAALDFHFVW